MSANPATIFWPRNQKIIGNRALGSSPQTREVNRTDMIKPDQRGALPRHPVSFAPRPAFSKHEYGAMEPSALQAARHRNCIPQIFQSAGCAGVPSAPRCSTELSLKGVLPTENAVITGALLA